MRLPAFVVSLTFGAVMSLGAQQAALKIVVLEGEDAVNVIQQTTAVRALVEVRDRNNLPVPGAVVTFTMGGGQHAAFAGGLQTLTVTTNAAGQAAAAGLSPIGTGAFQIQVQAAFQGQVATAAITQTNFATAAAAAAGNASGAGTGAGAGAGGGGGISGTTIGIVGAAVAGGAVVAAKELGGGDGDSGNGQGSSTTFTGPVSGQFDMSTTTASSTGSTTCISTRAISGTLTITLNQISAGAVSGNASSSGTISEIAFTASQFCSALPGPGSLGWGGPVTGSQSNLNFSSQSSGTGPTPNGGGSVTGTAAVSFVGSLANGVITGVVTYTDATNGTNQVGGISSTITGRGAVTINVTLR